MNNKINKWCCIILLNIIACTTFANDDELLNKANELYRNQQYESALTYYDSLLSLGHQTGMLYYNVGNTHFKLNNIAKAILYFEKAKLFDPSNEKIDHNLSKAKLMTIDRIEEIPEFFLNKTARNFILLFDSNTWSIASAMLFIFSLLLVLVFFLSKKNSLRRLGFYFSLLFLILSVFTFSFARKAMNHKVNNDAAIIMTPTVTMKGSPSESSSDLFIIHEGTKVFITDKVNDWLEIRLSDGKQGWLHANDIERI